MHNKLILAFLLLAILQAKSYGQDNTIPGFWADARVGLSGVYDVFNKSAGFIGQGEKGVLNSNHFEGYSGIAFQFSRQNEEDMFMDSGINGGSNDIGFYTTFQLEYYPFKRKSFLLGLEAFAGVTNFKSEGTLELPEYDIRENYSNSYTYLNYGLTPAIGYNFGRISTSVFSMVSLKGVFDKGRTRIGDADSRIFLGVNLSYSLKPSE